MNTKIDMDSNVSSGGGAVSVASSGHSRTGMEGANLSTRRQFMKKGGASVAALVAWTSLVETSKAVDDSSAVLVYGSVSFE